MFQAGRTLRIAAQHPGEFADPLLATQRRDACGGGVAIVGFLHQEVVIGATGYLGKVSDDKDLVMIGNLAQLLADPMADLATDPGIDLIEDQRGYPVLPGQDCLECEHDTGEFATGRDSRERARLESQIERDPKLYPLTPHTTNLRECREFDLESATAKT